MKLKCLALCGLLAFSTTALSNESAASYYEKALQYQQQQQLKKAELELRNSLQRDANYLPARLLLGQLLLKQGQWASAEKELQLALSGGAATDPLVYQLGRAMLAQQKADETRLLLARYPQLSKQAEYLLIQAGHQKVAFDYQAAQTSYQQLVASQPTEPLASEAWLELADLQFRMQQLDRAAESLKQVSPSSDVKKKARYLEARLAQSQNDSQRALAIYDQLLAQDDGDPAALLGKAQLLMQQNDTAKALALVTKFRDDNPHNPYGQLIHASLLGQSGDNNAQNRMLKQIQQQLSTLTTAQRDEEDVLMLTALLDFSDSRFDQAATKLIRYQQLYPANVQAHQLLAQSYLQLEDFRGAEKQIKAAIRLNPNDYTLQLIAAAVARAQKDVPTELSLLTASYQQFPQQPDVQKAYLQALLRSGKADQARALLTDKNGVSSLADQILLGYLQLENAQLQEAEKTAQHLLEQDSGKVEIFQLAGDVAAKSGDSALAEKFYQQALVLDATSKPALLSLASLALQQQNWQQASSLYQQILSHTPDDSLVLQLLADAAIKLKQPGDAIRYLEQLAADDKNLVAARLALLELYLQTQQTAKASELANALSEQMDIRPELYFAKARLGLQQQDRETTTHNTDILYGLWYDAPQQLVQLASLQLDNQDVSGLEKTLSRLKQFDEHQAQVAMLEARLALVRGKPKQGLALIQKVEQQVGRNLAIDELKAHLLLADQQPAAAAKLLEALYQQSGAIEHLLMLLRAKQHDAAFVQQQLTQWLAKHPSDLSATLLLAERLQQQGQTNQAIAVYQQSPLLDSQAVLLNNLANLLLDTQTEKALTFAKKAYQLMPDHPDIMDTYGYAQVLAGDANAGLGLLRDAEIRQPQAVLLQLHIAHALTLLNRTQEAKAILQRYKAEQLPLHERTLWLKLQTH